MRGQQKNLAFVFPGQGSQSVGMLTQLAASYPEVKQTFDKASFVLGRNLWDLVVNGPEEKLNQTQNTQPAMLAAGVAVWEVWCKHSAIRPAWMAGHSLGEYTALVCSGALFFEDAVKLVEARARFMQEAVPAGVGTMAAILGLDDDKIITICADVAGTEIVSAVNFNSPGQVVIAGHTAAVERAVAAAKEAGAKRAVMLPVSVPSHCALMLSAAEKLEECLRDIALETPKMHTIHNADVEMHTAPDVIRQVLKEQLYKPVRWVEGIELMHNKGVTIFIECGPGKVLTGLDKRIAKEAEHLAIYDPETLNKVLEQLND
ncbi:malonyl CoA-acyl carrier protein transacylase FabD [Methyloglobulus morosus KoM1]|uniref:Malonyl CoA-acyl carrier protein transacylase n=1 Tax=Methyloglobulus morosus KoM1 TaxID=1116472 RepID=V5DM45_9GAMM|nr:ACP S-malonyltransferase [Methyloglobulus morosus]ESS68481.1 malonyl CoA-acyl carrier protein transacylase FabD [Methyloglobulus morosus KoM1]